MDWRYWTIGVVDAVIAAWLVDRFWYPVPASLYGVRLGLVMAGIVMTGFAIGCAKLWCIEAISRRC